jgi:uncharacterized protein (TIGR03435 family)
MMKRLLVPACAIGWLAAVCAGDAQAPQTTAAPTFEAASVKANKEGAPFISIGMQPNGRYTATNVPLRLLIQNAYQIQNFQLIGAPGWIDTERFDIVAKADPAVMAPPPGSFGSNGFASGPTPVQLMLRALLGERFKLAAHTETRELPIYALVVARKDGKLGPQLMPVSEECAAQIAARGRGARGGPGGPGGSAVTGIGRGPGGLPAAPPPPIPGPGEKMACGNTRMGPASLSSGGVTMAQFASQLSQQQFANRTVLDKTGLSGIFALDLNFTPDLAGRGDPPPGVPPLNVDPNGPDFFTAIQEQLGLKLDAQKGPVEVVVVDRVEHPTDD